jgi:hypothetical protein
MHKHSRRRYKTGNQLAHPHFIDDQPAHRGGRVLAVQDEQRVSKSVLCISPNSTALLTRRLAIEITSWKIVKASTPPVKYAELVTGCLAGVNASRLHDMQNWS